LLTKLGAIAAAGPAAIIGAGITGAIAGAAIIGGIASGIVIGIAGAIGIGIGMGGGTRGRALSTTGIGNIGPFAATSILRSDSIKQISFQRSSLSRITGVRGLSERERERDTHHMPVRSIRRPAGRSAYQGRSTLLPN
jgi:hypothetical protein